MVANANPREAERDLAEEDAIRTATEIVVAAAGDQIWHMMPIFGPGTRTRGYRKIEGPDHLWAIAVQYFQWCLNNPIKKHKLITVDGRVQDHYERHVRAFTQEGFMAFCALSEETVRNWQNPKSNAYREEMIPVLKHIAKVIYDQKFTAAAVGAMNPAFIGKALGLQEHLVTKDITPPEDKPKPAPVAVVAIADQAMLAHPDDPDPEGSGLLFTQAQIDAGVEFPA